jgi:hypothetical protein
MRTEIMKGTDAQGRVVEVRRLIPETDADIEVLRERARNCRSSAVRAMEPACGGCRRSGTNTFA